MAPSISTLPDQPQALRTRVPSYVAQSQQGRPDSSSLSLRFPGHEGGVSCLAALCSGSEADASGPGPKGTHTCMVVL